jgi:hypothetical protein
LRGVGDRQPFQNIIITILNHEHFSHGTSTFNGNSVTMNVWKAKIGNNFKYRMVKDTTTMTSRQ